MVSVEKVYVYSSRQCVSVIGGVFVCVFVSIFGLGVCVCMSHSHSIFVLCLVSFFASERARLFVW